MDASYTKVRHILVYYILQPGQITFRTARIPCLQFQHNVLSFLIMKGIAASARVIAEHNENLQWHFIRIVWQCLFSPVRLDPERYSATPLNTTLRCPASTNESAHHFCDSARHLIFDSTTSRIIVKVHLTQRAVQEALRQRGTSLTQVAFTPTHSDTQYTASDL